MSDRQKKREEYQKEYRRKHPEKFQNAIERYESKLTLEDKNKRKEYYAEYYLKNKERILKQRATKIVKVYFFSSLFDMHPQKVFLNKQDALEELEKFKDKYKYEKDYVDNLVLINEQELDLSHKIKE